MPPTNPNPPSVIKRIESSDGVFSLYSDATSPIGIPKGRTSSVSCPSNIKI